jgi:FPC/CPF motif-containing protein YcgG
MNTFQENIVMTINEFPMCTPAPLVGCVSADIDYTEWPYCLSQLPSFECTPAPLVGCVSADIDYTEWPYCLSQLPSFECTPAPLIGCVSADIDYTVWPYVPMSKL